MIESYSFSSPALAVAAWAEAVEYGCQGKRIDDQGVGASRELIAAFGRTTSSTVRTELAQLLHGAGAGPLGD